MRALRSGVLAAYLAGWLGTGLHAWAEGGVEPCGCGPGPSLLADCDGCDRPSDHHHHTGGHDHAACVSCKAFTLSALPTECWIGVGARVSSAVRPVDAPVLLSPTLSSTAARGPPR